MHDPLYRLGVAWQNVAYNQPAHPGFYLGDGMEAGGDGGQSKHRFYRPGSDDQAHGSVEVRKAQ